MILTVEDDARLRAAGESAGPIALLRQASSDVQALLERVSLRSRHGFSYDGARDLNKGLGRVKNLEIANYRARYRRGGLFKRLIRAAPKATWVSGATIEEEPEPEITTAFEEEIAALFTKLKVYPLLQRADILARLGRYSVLLIGGVGKAEDLKEELSFDSNGPTYLRPLAEDNAHIEEFEKDPRNARFNQPTLYKIKIQADPRKSKSLASAEDVFVHWSRCIHIVPDPLESDIYGTPAGEAVWDLFDDLLKVTGGGAEAAWKMQDPGLALNIDPKHAVTPADVQKLKDEMLAYQHDPQKRYLMSRGVEIEQLTPGAVNFGANAKTLLEQIAGTEEIPLRILLGSERGELSSAQDERNWNKRMEERWVLFADPILHMLVDRLIDHGGIKAKPKQYSVIRPEAAELDDEETAALAVSISTANKSQVDAGDTVILPSKEIRFRLYGLAPLEAPEPGPQGLRGAAEPSGEYAAVRDAAVAAEASHEAAWRGLWADMEEALPSAEVLEGVLAALDSDAIRVAVQSEDETGDTSEALDDLLAVPLDLIDAALADPIAAFKEPLKVLLSATFTEGAERSLDVVEERGSYLLDGDPAFAPVAAAWRVAAEFDAINPRAVAWAAEKAAETVTVISSEARETIRTIISRSLGGEETIARSANLIRQTVGLRADQARSILALGEKLASARPGSTVRKGGLTFKVPKSGASKRFLERAEARYTTRSLRIRAELIRQSETARAANAGLRESWFQARDAGALPDDVLRVWIDSGDDRVRPTHAEVNGEEVGLDEDFSIGVEPGEEARCRCGQGLVRAA